MTLGASTDMPVPADYDGDGITDAAVYHPSTGTWTIRTASSGFTAGSTFQWGVPGDVPVPGDYDGDGKADMAVYRRASGLWFIRQSTTGNTTFVSFQFGLSTATRRCPATTMATAKRTSRSGGRPMGRGSSRCRRPTTARRRRISGD